MKAADAIAFFTCTVLATGSAAFDASLLPWEFDDLPTRAEEFTTYKVPVGPYRDGDIRSLVVEGSLKQSVIRVGGTQSTLELLSEVRDLLNRTSHVILFQCEARDCGGFDFRLNTDVARAPEMYVDLGDFRFLSAVRVVASGAEYVTLLISRSETIGFVQISELATSERPKTGDGPLANQIERGAIPFAGSDSLVETLRTYGFAVFETLEFESGSTSLGDAIFPELRDLARYLNENPDVTVVLVGHTDARGSLESNVELSTQRAESVQRHLIEAHGVESSQLLAEGIGFLAPRATNKTAEGRERNRRVEVVVLDGN